MNEDAKTNLRNVMAMALADGTLGKEEKQLIESMRQRLGIDAEEFGRLCEEVGKDPTRVSLPPGGDQARMALDALIEMAAVDGQIQPPEQALLLRLGEHVGFDAPQIDQLTDQALGATEGDQAATTGAIDEVYAYFQSWDAATRQEKINALAARGRAAVIPLLRVLESYRMPDGAPDALALKTAVARALGRMGDPRAAYYLCQQINIGDMNDEATCAELRCACAEAIGKIFSTPIAASQEGIEEVRRWWLSEAGKRYDRLAF